MHQQLADTNFIPFQYVPYCVAIGLLLQCHTGPIITRKKLYCKMKEDHWRSIYRKDTQCVDNQNLTNPSRCHKKNTRQDRDKQRRCGKIRTILEHSSSPILADFSPLPYRMLTQFGHEIASEKKGNISCFCRLRSDGPLWLSMADGE